MSEAMTAFVPVAVVILVVVAGLIAFQLTPAKRRRRLLRAAPRVAIADLTPGAIAKVRGTVVLDDALESPIGRVRCACWQVDVSFQEYSVPNHGMRWYQSIQREARRDFGLQDATGMVRVATQTALLELMPSRQEHRNDALPEHVAHFLASEGVSHEGLLRFEERTVIEGAEVEVIGEVRAGPDGPVLVDAPKLPVAVLETLADT